MRRTLVAALACAAAFAVAPVPAQAALCVGDRFIEGWTGVCALGDGWLLCAREANMYPALEVYVPGPGDEPCHP